MIKLVLGLLKKLNPFALQAAPSQLSYKSREDALNIIADRGYVAYFWLPGIAHNNDKELQQALKLLKNAGYIITDDQGGLVGKVVKVRLSKDEKARARRASFKLVESNQ
jgi:hypothetical protein